MTRVRGRKVRPPLDEEGLEQAALTYSGRYATTRARLAGYLRRKLRERGWAGQGEPPLQRLVEKMSSLGYVDDRAFASARAASLGRRGYGERRVREALRAAGVEGEDSAEAEETARGEAWAAALRFAEKRRIGPYAAAEADPATRRKQLAAMLRAGHPGRVAQPLVRARPGEFPDMDEL